MKNPNKKSSTSSLSGFRAQTLAPINCGTAERNFRKHEITFEEAIPYIWDYAERFPGLAINSGGGAEICRERLGNFESTAFEGVSPALLHCGLLLYFCSYRGTFFLAYKIKQAMDDGVPQFPPFEDTLYYLSDCEFLFNISDITSVSNLTDSLRNYSNICDCSSEPAAVLKHEIRNYGEEFMDNFGDASVIIYPIGFFHKDQVSMVITQNDGSSNRCIGIRFYWGYKNLPSTPTTTANDGYKIKLVAFGIGMDGKNIITNGSTEGIMLECSWPPF